MSRKHTTITVDLSKTVGQSSAIEANGGPLFEIRVTCPVTVLPAAKDGSYQESPGFGKVTSDGRVKGHTVLFTAESIVHDAPGAVLHAERVA